VSSVADATPKIVYDRDPALKDRATIIAPLRGASNRLITRATPEGTLSYSYDVASNVLSMQSSNVNGVNVGYSYDELNRLETVTDNAPINPSSTNPRPASGPASGPGVTTYRYDDVGNLAGYLYPNGVDTSYTTTT
jgi:YD repeat-containing protein